MTRRPPLLLLFVTVLGACGALAAAEDPLPGFYDAAGVSPKGTPYTAIVQIVRTGDTYHMQWTFEEGGTVGVAIRYKDTLIASFVVGHTIGIARYHIKGSTLEGMWSSYGSIAQMKETLTRRATAPPPQPHRPRVVPPTEHREHVRWEIRR